MSAADTPRPVEIDRSEETEIRIAWSDGHRTVYPARVLRLLCPCAECVDETTGVRILDPAKVPEDVRAGAIRLVGRYAVEFDWTDGHSTGIYTFEGLRWFCPCPDCREKRKAAE